jgi:hypothetical protein
MRSPIRTTISLNHVQLYEINLLEKMKAKQQRIVVNSRRVKQEKSQSFFGKFLSLYCTGPTILPQSESYPTHIESGRLKKGSPHMLARKHYFIYNLELKILQQSPKKAKQQLSNMLMQ